MNKELVGSRLSSLDGWRALSIFLVLGSHVAMMAPLPDRHQLNFLFDGRAGVRFFFVISGFLITWLMALELSRTDRIHLKHFYLRRGLRILPVYLVFLLVLLGFQCLTAFRETTAGWISLLTFTRNYFDGSSAGDHCWSLSVEEQFYLIWPAIFLFSWRGRDFKKGLYVLTLPFLTAPIFRGVGYLAAHPNTHLLGNHAVHLGFAGKIFAAESFFCQYDALAFGCFGAIILAHHRPILAIVFEKHSHVIGWSASVLVMATYFGGLILPAALMAPFGPSLQAFGFAVLLLHSVLQPQWGIYRALNWWWVRQVGILSYSIYIWQQIFWVRPWLPENHAAAPVWWLWFWIIPVLAVATVSYYGLERPLLKLRSRFRDV